MCSNNSGFLNLSLYKKKKKLSRHSRIEEFENPHLIIIIHNIVLLCTIYIIYITGKTVVFRFTLCWVEPALDIVKETSGYRQIPVPLRSFPAVRVMVVLLSLLSRWTVTTRSATSSYATPSTAAAIGACSTGLLTVMMVLIVMVAMVVVMVVVLLRRRPVLMLLRLLSIIPPFPAIILMRYHAVHDGTADVDLVVRRDQFIRSLHTTCMVQVNCDYKLQILILFILIVDNI